MVMHQKTSNTFLAVIILIVGVLAFRLIPHMPNFTPVVGATLFSAAFFKDKKWMMFVPFVLIFIGDFIINNTIARAYFTEEEGLIFFSNYMIYTFISYALILAIGSTILKNLLWKNVLLSQVISTLLFFVVTNFGTWLHATSLYTKDFSGLLSCYIAALPFLNNAFLGDLISTTVLFGSYFAISYWWSARSAAEA